MNIVIHAIGIALAVYGIWTMNWTLIIVAPIVMELGHMWNHIRGIKPYPIRVIPLQIAIYITFLLIVYVIKITIGA